MTSIHVTERLSYPAGAVWALIGDFGGLHRWHSQVRRLDLSWEGRIRTLHYADGSRTVERLEARPDGEHCLVAWSSDFDVLGDAERVAEAAMRSTYRAGLGALAAALGSL